MAAPPSESLMPSSSSNTSRPSFGHTAVSQPSPSPPPLPHHHRLATSGQSYTPPGGRRCCLPCLGGGRREAEVLLDAEAEEKEERA